MKAPTILLEITIQYSVCESETQHILSFFNFYGCVDFVLNLCLHISHVEEQILKQYEKDVLFSEEALCAAIDTLITDDVICPICQKYLCTVCVCVCVCVCTYVCVCVCVYVCMFVCVLPS